VGGCREKKDNNRSTLAALNPQREQPMKCDKYMGMDVHQATTVVAVLDAEGKMVLETIVDTQAASIIRLVQSLSGPVARDVRGDDASRVGLYEVVRYFVTEVIVCDPRRNKLLGEGSKGDKVDARKLANLLRTGMVRAVHHGESTRQLKELVRGYETICRDNQRTMARIKAIFRARGIRTPGRNVYQAKQREQWLQQLDEPGVRQRVGWLYEQLDHLKPLRRQAKQAMLQESRKYKGVQLLRTIPQLGAIRAALIVATVDTPHRFRTRHQLWSYSGLAVITHMSSEYELQEGHVVRSRKPIATRGLNRNCNRRMKDVFIGAATGGSQTEPYRGYLQGLQNKGMRKEMARLTLARKIAAIALRIWKKGETFDPKKLNWTT
jgi:transposase